MGESKQLKHYFDKDLAVMLADKICPVYSGFKKQAFVKEVVLAVQELELKQRVATIADALFQELPSDYTKTLNIFAEILGPENRKETGMFTEGYWLMPVAYYVEKYGIEHFTESVRFIEELTKRHTGEYAIRPFLVTYPLKTLKVMSRWSKSNNTHVRRLASEGLRPRLP
ncbi:MAG: DNA alkylation repair protein [Nitrospirales bacterium]